MLTWLFSPRRPGVHLFGRKQIASFEERDLFGRRHTASLEERDLFGRRQSAFFEERDAPCEVC